MSSSSASGWECLLQLHKCIRSQIEERLKKVDLELGYLDALRESLTPPRQVGLPVRRTVVLPPASSSSPSSSSSTSRPRPRKRNREDAVSVGYLSVHATQKRTSRERTEDPFEDAGLYAEEGNPIAQFAPLQLSSDEVTRQQLLTLFPTTAPTGVRKVDNLPSPAVARIKSRMRAAGVAETAFSIGRRTPREAYVCINASFLAEHRKSMDNVRHLIVFAKDPQEVQKLRSDYCADPGAVGSCLYVALAERAVAHTLPPFLHGEDVAVHLLALRHLAMTPAETVAWTFTQCCQCCDRDVMESEQVQWAQTLRSAMPPSLPSYVSLPRDTVLYAALCYTLLKKLAAASTTRQGYLIYVLTACSGYPQLLDSHALTSARSWSALAAPVSEAFESELKLLR